jgi:hypothetical protein
MDVDALRIQAMQWLNRALRTEDECRAYVVAVADSMLVLHFEAKQRLYVSMALVTLFGLDTES